MTSDDEIISHLKDIARWTRLVALPVVKERVELLLDSDPKKRVYDAIANRSTTLSAVEKSTGVNHNSIREWTKLWELAGIVETVNGAPKATFTLSELGISPAPPRPIRKKRQS